MRIIWCLAFIVMLLPRISFGAPAVSATQSLDFGQVGFAPNGQIILNTSGNTTVSGGVSVSGLTSQAIVLVSGLVDGDVIN